MSKGEFVPSFAVQYYPDDLQVRLFYIEQSKDREELMFLMRIFPSPAGPEDEKARDMITRFLLYFQYEA